MMHSIRSDDSQIRHEPYVNDSPRSLESSHLLEFPNRDKEAKNDLQGRCVIRKEMSFNILVLVSVGIILAGGLIVGSLKNTRVGYPVLYAGSALLALTIGTCLFVVCRSVKEADKGDAVIPVNGEQV